MKSLQYRPYVEKFEDTKGVVYLRMRYNTMAKSTNTTQKTKD
jgi:hypothetical protein